MRRRKTKCPHCGERLEHRGLSPQAKLNISELGPGMGAVMTQCPHCRGGYFVVDGKVMADWEPEDLAGRSVVVDMTAHEKQDEAVTLLNQEGDALMRRGRVDMAKAKFEQAIKLSAHDPMSWYNLGVARLHSDDLPGAEDAFRHAVEYDADLANAWSNLGFVQLQNGKPTEALRSFEMGIAADPDYPKCYVGKGQILATIGKVDEGRRCLEKALKLDPGSVAAKQALQTLSARR